MTRQTDLAWAAGFLDGEGCIWAKAHNNPTRGKRDRQLKISAAQVDREVLDRLVSIFGFGKVYGPYPSSSDVGKPYYRWDLNHAANVVAILKLIWPYLGTVKRAQALSAMNEYQFMGYQGSGTARNDLSNDIVELRSVI